MFKHILNFMRNSKLLIPHNFADLSLLYEESKYFELDGIIVKMKFSTQYKYVWS